MGKPTPKKSVWVLTTEHNDYDQHGEYFVAVFETKPTIKELAALFAPPKGLAVPGYHQDPVSVLSFLLHLLDGGGRQDIEEQWYNLNEVEFGKKYG